MPSVNIVYSSRPSVRLPGKLDLSNQGNEYQCYEIELCFYFIVMSKDKKGNIKLSEYSQEEPDFRVICMLSPLYRRSGSVHRDFPLLLLKRVE